MSEVGVYVLLQFLKLFIFIPKHVTAKDNVISRSTTLNKYQKVKQCTEILYN